MPETKWEECEAALLMFRGSPGQIKKIIEYIEGAYDKPWYHVYGIIVEITKGRDKIEGEIEMTEENEDHGMCECCKTEKAVVSILKTAMKVCLACAPKFI